MCDWSHIICGWCIVVVELKKEKNYYWPKQRIVDDMRRLGRVIPPFVVP
jgi:hypothetical protein